MNNKGITVVTIIVTISVIIIISAFTIIGGRDLLIDSRDQRNQEELLEVQTMVNAIYLKRGVAGELGPAGSSEEYDILSEPYINEERNINEEMGWYTYTPNGSKNTYYINYGKNLVVRSDEEIELDHEDIVTEVLHANKPKLGVGMTPVYFDEGGNEITDAAAHEEGVTYEYIAAESDGDHTTSKWANAKTADGSYWVWIPRYAYKITYYTNNTYSVVADYRTAYGKVDVKFLVGTSNENYYDENGESRLLPEGYIVHPAFQMMNSSDTANQNPLGKWDKELTGIWMSKYGAVLRYNNDGSYSNMGYGYQNYTNTFDPEQYSVASVPGYALWKYVSVDVAYSYCLALNAGLNSHLCKNSEWGALAYLTQSQYGRNGYEVLKRDGQITSVATSTTGNIYGVYDCSGVGVMLMASYVDNANTALTDYGNSLVSSNDFKTKQVYQISSTGDTSPNNYNQAITSGIYGDCTWEVSRQCGGNNSWHGDVSGFPNTTAPFFARTGLSWYSSNAGLFCINTAKGSTDNGNAFRAVLVVEP